MYASQSLPTTRVDRSPRLLHRVHSVNCTRRSHAHQTAARHVSGDGTLRPDLPRDRDRLPRIHQVSLSTLAVPERARQSIEISERILLTAPIFRGEASPYTCIPCEGDECEELAEFCPYGESRDQCNRRVCAKVSVARQPTAFFYVEFSRVPGAGAGVPTTSWATAGKVCAANPTSAATAATSRP